MPVDLEFALHVPDPNHQGNEIDASATRAAEEVLRSLAGQRYVVGRGCDSSELGESRSASIH
jgi:hypothetical protein